LAIPLSGYSHTPSSLTPFILALNRMAPRKFVIDKSALLRSASAKSAPSKSMKDMSAPTTAWLP
jgi:hypothetical protein